MSDIKATLREYVLSAPDHIAAVNEVRAYLHEISPLAGEPVDCVLWVPAEKVTANDYNPNSVAPPEMKLLEHSIMEDGARADTTQKRGL